jgi:hypothetical protein
MLGFPSVLIRACGTVALCREIPITSHRDDGDAQNNIALLCSSLLCSSLCRITAPVRQVASASVPEAAPAAATTAQRRLAAVAAHLVAEVVEPARKIPVLDSCEVRVYSLPLSMSPLMSHTSFPYVFICVAATACALLP